MKRLFCFFLMLAPLAGCALFEDCAAFSEREWHKFTDDTSCNGGPVRACGEDPIVQTGANFPAQTAEPPR
jgi:hypothetical protein